MGVHVADDDLVLTEELLGKCHGSIMPDNDSARTCGSDRSAVCTHDVGVDDADRGHESEHRCGSNEAEPESLQIGSQGTRFG